MGFFDCKEMETTEFTEFTEFIVFPEFTGVSREDI